MSLLERKKGSREILPLRVKDERERQRVLTEGTNPYQSLIYDDNIPCCLTKKADLVVLVGLAHQISPSPGDIYDKFVFPKEDFDGIEGCLKGTISSGQEAGVATCYYNGAGRAPYWAGKFGIKTNSDIEAFLKGYTNLTQEELEKYPWIKRGFTQTAKNDLSLSEIIITPHPKDYGLVDSRHLIGRIRLEENGSLYGEIGLGWRLRALEGDMDARTLIDFSTDQFFKVKGLSEELERAPGISVVFGENYLKPIIQEVVAKVRNFFTRSYPDINLLRRSSGEIVPTRAIRINDEAISVAHNFLREAHRLLYGPADLRSLLEVLGVYGLDTLEIIGMKTERGIWKAKLYEVR